MKLSDLTSQAGEWLRGSGPMSEIVISSAHPPGPKRQRVSFLTRCTRSQRQVWSTGFATPFFAAQLSQKTLYVDLDSAPDVDRQLLVERHLISKRTRMPKAPAGGRRRERNPGHHG